jgi:molecular chaperone GrpE
MDTASPTDAALGGLPETDDKSRMAAQQAEILDLKDKLLRALADVENTRRQSERAVADAKIYAVSEFAREMLRVSDNLRRTLAAGEEQAGRLASDPLLEGVGAIDRMLSKIFERFGVEMVPALSRPFDPHVHEAVLEVQDPALAAGTIATVFEEGYKIHDRLMRPARVAVVRRAPDRYDAEDGFGADIPPRPEGHERAR